MARAWLRAGAWRARARRGKALATAAMAQKQRLRSEVRYCQLLSGSATGASKLRSACYGRPRAVVVEHAAAILASTDDAL